jgi:hypothetical protein
MTLLPVLNTIEQFGMPAGQRQQARFRVRDLSRSSPGPKRDKTRTLNCYGTNAFGIGLSPFAPNCCINVPAVERWMNHVALDGRNTVVSYLPSPS